MPTGSIVTQVIKRRRFFIKQGKDKINVVPMFRFCLMVARQRNLGVEKTKQNIICIYKYKCTAIPE
jgi:hypothetical protein